MKYARDRETVASVISFAANHHDSLMIRGHDVFDDSMRGIFHQDDFRNTAFHCRAIHGVHLRYGEDHVFTRVLALS